MIYSRRNLVNVAQACLGTVENTERHQVILDIYNEYARQHNMYKMKNTDAWCACFVSACFIACEYATIIPIDCSCQRMISSAILRGQWVENDGYVPKAGDLIFYDWQDNGKGDCKGTSDHVGIVESCIAGKITVIEGNYSDMVKRRVINVDGRYIRGYIIPRYNHE